MAQAQYSTPTRDVENPARTPFQASETLTLTQGIGASFNTTIADVPVNTRLVVEYASVQCTGPSASGPAAVSLAITQRTGPSSFSSLGFQLPVRNQGTSAFGDSIYVAGTPVRLYADRGTSGGGVAAGVLRRGATGTTTCIFTISGHTINI